jgi:hypothetical protein
MTAHRIKNDSLWRHYASAVAIRIHSVLSQFLGKKGWWHQAGGACSNKTLLKLPTAVDSNVGCVFLHSIHQPIERKPSITGLIRKPAPAVAQRIVRRHGGSGSF